MTAYWSTLAYQSLFEPSRFFGRQEEARAFDYAFCAEFLGALQTEDFGRALAEGASAKLLKALAFVADEMRPLPEARPNATPGQADAGRGLRRSHARLAP